MRETSFKLWQTEYFDDSRMRKKLGVIVIYMGMKKGGAKIYKNEIKREVVKVTENMKCRKVWGMDEMTVEMLKYGEIVTE